MQTMYEVMSTVLNLPYAFDETTKSFIPLFKDLRITPHSKLSEPHRSFNKETNSFEDDEFTNMSFIFGDLYDRISEDVTKEPSLNKTDEESTEEWKERVQTYRDKREEERKSRRDRNELNTALYRINPQTSFDYYLSTED